MLPRLTLILAASVLALGGCSNGREKPHGTNAVLYTIGFSSDPYGHSHPGGLGVATDLEEKQPKKVEIRGHGLGQLGGADWIDEDRMLVSQSAPPLRAPLVYRYAEGKLQRVGPAPVPAGAGFAWSPDRKLVAYEPARPCSRGQRSLFSCYKTSGQLFVVSDDGHVRRKVARGHFLGWTRDGRLAFFRSYRRATTLAFDLHRDTAAPIFPSWKAGLPVWSADGRYVIAPGGAGILLADPNGVPVRTISTRLVVSLVAWSPSGHRFAYTTSGFPDPHQLFVVDSPTAEPRLLYTTGARHFDWVTWSPDGRWLLLDDEHRHRWLLFRTDRSGVRRDLPRLGGRPVWCCPPNAFVSVGGTQAGWRR